MKWLTILICLTMGSVASAQTTSLRTLDTDYSAASWKAVGRIDFGRSAFCSGTLIAPDLVLTAAHCLYRPGSDRLWPTDSIRFHAGLRDGDAEKLQGPTAREAGRITITLSRSRGSKSVCGIKVGSKAECGIQ